MKKSSKRPAWISVALGIGVTIGLTLLLSLILSGISVGAKISDGLCAALVCIIVIVSWLAGAFVLGVERRQKGLLWGAIHSGGLFVILFASSLIVNRGIVAIFSVKTLLYLLGGALVGGVGGVLGVQFALKRR